MSLCLILLLFSSSSIDAQIFLAGSSNSNAGNPDAIIPVAGIITNGTFLAQTPEACIQGDGVNNGVYGHDPEWRFDIAIPSGSGPVSPSCSNIEIRVCRRGDFGQSTEATFVYDEDFNEIGLIPGHPANSSAFDCTDEPICSIITLNPCAFNSQTNDGTWSITLYTNGSLSGNSVGDFCSPAAGPQADGDAANCTSDCPTYTQSVGGIFDNQASGGPIVNTSCTGCNCAFIDYIKMDIAISDTVFTMSSTVQGVNNPITLTPAAGLTCPQNWTVNGGTTGLATTSGITTFTTSISGSYNICNNVGTTVCQSVNCKTITFLEEICDNGIDDDLDGLIDCNDPDCGLSGSCDLCYEEENATEYKINSVANGVDYTWSVPSGAIITSQPSDTFIIVDYSGATSGLDSVKVVVSDGICNKDSVSFYQNIMFCNDPPVAVDDYNTTDEGVSVITPVINNDIDPDDNIDPTSVTIISSSVNTMTVNVIPIIGAIFYMPAPDYYGMDTIVYSVCDYGGLCDTATLYINVLPIADPIDAQNDNGTTQEDIPLVTSVLSNDTDPDNDIDTSSVTVSTPPTNGLTSVNPLTGEITYTPNPHFYGNDSYTYQVCDLTAPTPLCDNATVSVSINPVNDEPVAINDNEVTNEDTPITINVLSNDSDSNDPLGNIDPTTISIFTNPTNGIAGVNPVSGEITYTPSLDYFGMDSLTYQVCDDGNPLPALCSTATLYINVINVNDPPVAMDDSESTQEDTPVTIVVLNNDTDSDGTIDTTSVSISMPSANGTTSIDPITGEIVFTPSLNFNGPAIFEYQVCDNNGTCDTATVAIAVAQVNDPPVSMDDYNTTDEGVSVITPVIDNDLDPDDNINPTSVTVISSSINAISVNVIPIIGAIFYMPAPDYYGMDTIVYSVCDYGGLCDTATLYINVLPIADPINAQDDNGTTLEDTPFSLSVLSNDTDPDNDIDTSSVVVSTPPTNGSTSVNPLTGEVTYTPNPNFYGNDSLTYQVCDLTSPTPFCDNATVSISVDPVNDEPVASNDNGITNEEITIATNVSGNDMDVDGNLDLLSVTIITNSLNGVANINASNGQIIYTPSANYNGLDSLEYSICDTDGLCDTATLYINVLSIADPVDAQNDNGTTQEDVSLVTSVLSNDTDPDNDIDNSSVTVITAPTNGTTSINSITGEIIYIPNPNFNGNDSYSYQVCDLSSPTPFCDSATVSISVEPVNDNPIVNDDNTSANEDNPVIIDVLANDNDDDDPLGNIDPSTVSILTNPTNGTTSVNPITGKVTYTPNPNFNGTDIFTYQVCDDGFPLPATCDMATVTINVTSTNDAPVANNDLNITNEEVSVAVIVANNDTDIDGNIDPSTVTMITPSVNGTTIVNPTNGAIVYTPNSNFNGMDSLVYSICDTNGLCDSATLFINVLPIADPIIAIDDNGTIDEDTDLVSDVLANDTDGDNNIDASSVMVITPPANGTTSADPTTGEITYTPNPHFNGNDSYNYQVCNLNTPSPVCDIATVYISVNPVNDFPIAINDAISVLQDSFIVVNFTTNDDDPMDPLGGIDPTSVGIITPPTNGSTTVNPITGEVTYVPNMGFYGNDSLAYVVCDTGNPLPALCDTAQILISVILVNNPPVIVNGDGNPIDTLEVTMMEDIPDTTCLTIIDNDVSSNSNSLTCSILLSPLFGTVTILNDTCFIYQPNPNYHGVDTLIKVICDSYGACDTLSVFYEVAPVNDNPIAIDDQVSVNEDSLIEITVLSNDSDPNDPTGGIDPTSVGIISPPTNGTVTVNPITGSITYEPNLDFSGLDIFTYIVCDTGYPLPGTCDTAMVVIDVSEDTDDDGIPDLEDLDSDNDGIPDVVEDGNGNPDITDLDGDGIPNRNDLDSDNDGIADVIEAGGTDDDGDGMLDGYVDVNSNGLSDLVDPSLNGTPLPMWNTDATGFFNYLDIDSDGDGILDNIESQPSIGFIIATNVDINGNGWDDAYDGNASGTPVPLTNTDGIDEPDFMDLDSENDGILDSVEGHDSNYDGFADTLPTNSDSDLDGLDDAYDLFVGISTNNASGANAPIQDTDSDNTPDYRDIDSDGDGLTDYDECPVGFNCPDIDSDGTPDYLDLICNELLVQPTITINSLVCATDTIIMFVQNEYLTSINQIDTSDIMFYWFNGNGDTIAIQQEQLFSIPANDPLAISPFSVQVTAQGCISSISQSSEVNIIEIPIDLTATNSGGNCGNEDIMISAEFFPNATYEWRVSGTTTIISTEREYTISNLTATTTFEVTVYIEPCMIPGITTTTVEIFASPEVTVVQPNAIMCADGTQEILLDATVTGGATPVTYEWNGPNNFYSVNEDPILNNVTFETSGSYSFVVTDANGCQTTTTVEVDVNDAPSTPNIISTNPVCDGGTINLFVQNYAGANVTYVWETPNGVTTNISGINSNEITISPTDHSIHSGNYQVIVTVDGCEVTSNIFNLVLPEHPDAAPTFTFDGDCQSGNLQLFANASNASGNSTFAWNGPNGFTSNSENPFINNPTADAIGDYSLLVTNNNGCTFSTSLIITGAGIGTPPETPTIFTNSPICEDEMIHFSLAQQYPSNATIQWYNGQGVTIGSGLVLDFPTTDQNAIPPYTVVVEFNGCSSDVSEQVIVDILPIKELEAFNNSPVCVGEEVQLFASDIPNATYQWKIEGTNTVISNEQNPTIIASSTTTNYEVEIITNYDCVVNTNATTTVEVSTFPIISNVSGAGAYCQGDVVTLIATISEEGTYTWTGPNGFIQNGTTGASSPFSAIVTLTGNIASGIYTLKTTSNLGCGSDSENVQVEINPTPEAPELTTAVSAICEGDILQLNSTASTGTNVNYQWFFNSDLLATTSSPTYLIMNSTPANSGMYSVQAMIDGCGSPGSNVVFINVFGATTVIEASNNSSSTDAICEGEDVQLEVPFILNAIYQWYGPAGYASAGFNPLIENVTIANQGDYFAVISLNGCETVVSTTTTVFVNPTPETPTITSNGPICEGDEMVFTVSSPLIVPTDSSMVFTWYAAGTNQLLAETYEPTFSILGASISLSGEYYMITTVDGCNAEPTEVTTIEINETPANSAIAGEDFEICSAASINLNAEAPSIGTGIWTTTSGATIANPDMPNTEVVSLDLGENIFVWSLSNGICENYDSDTIIITLTQAPDEIANAGIDFEICNTNDVYLTASTPTFATGTWTQSDDQAGQGVIIVDPNNPISSVYGLENGNTYTFTWSLSEGSCNDFSNDEVNISVYDVPIENAYIAMQDYIYLCDAEDINLEAIAPTIASGMWTVNSDALIVNATSNNTIAADLAIGENMFVWSLSNGVCENYSSDTIYVYVENMLEANADTFSIVYNDSLMNVNILDNDYIDNVNNWNISISQTPNNGSFDLDENGILSYIPNENFFGTDSLIYRLCNVNCPSNCDTALITIDVTGISPSGECFIPNVLTPNQNGVNDYFIIPCLDNYNENSITIFNRWGDEIHQATPYDNSWDGTYKGKDLPAGTYFYILDVKTNGTPQTIKGYITLFR